MSIFSVPQKNIVVEIYYVDVDGNLVFFQDKSIIKDELKAKIKTAVAEFAYESWEGFNRSMKLCISKNPETGEGSLDPISLRDLRLRKLLKKLTDGDGVEIPVNVKEISGWSPDFCVALMNGYMKNTENLFLEVLKLEDIKNV